MANPYAFGQKDYTAMDRRRKVIDEAMQKNFETSASIMQMQKEKERRDRTNALASVYSSALEDSTLTPEQKVDIGIRTSAQLHGIGSYPEAQGVMEHAKIYSELAGKRLQQRSTKPEDVFLGYTNLPNGAKGIKYGIPKTETMPEVVHEIKPLSEKEGGRSGSDATDRINREKKRQLSLKAQQLGIDIDSINKGKYLFFDPDTQSKKYVGAYDTNGVENQAGIELRDRKQKELEQVQQEIQLLQAELGDVVTRPKNRKETVPPVVQPSAKQEDKFITGKKYISNGIVKTYLGNGKWE